VFITFSGVLRQLWKARKNVRSSEEVLLNYLFDGYNPTARPVFNSSLTVAVNLRFSLLQIQDLVVVDYRRHHHHVYYS